MFSKTVEHDKFLTDPKIAKLCINKIKNISSYDTIIEPSAGDGSFSLQILNCVAYDLKPGHSTIQKKDFFTLEQPKGKKILFVGNPPFGLRNKLSKEFIKHCLKLNATTIAFILPNVFNKLINQNVFPKNWRLVSITELPINSFIANGEECHIPCSFFIWTKTPGTLNLRQKKVEKTKDFTFLSRGSADATYCINGNSGKVRLPSEITNDKAEHFIKTKLPKKVFETLKYEFNSSVNGGVAWIGRQEILKAYYDYLRTL